MIEDQRSEELHESRQHWRRLAYLEKMTGEYEAQRGRTDAVQLVRAKTYNDCADSIELQIRTGIPHCVCHLIPMSECMERAKTNRK